MIQGVVLVATRVMGSTGSVSLTSPAPGAWPADRLKEQLADVDNGVAGVVLKAAGSHTTTATVLVLVAITAGRLVFGRQPGPADASSG